MQISDFLQHSFSVSFGKEAFGIGTSQIIDFFSPQAETKTLTQKYSFVTTF